MMPTNRITPRLATFICNIPNIDELRVHWQCKCCVSQGDESSVGANDESNGKTIEWYYTVFPPFDVYMDLALAVHVVNKIFGEFATFFVV